MPDRDEEVEEHNNAVEGERGISTTKRLVDGFRTERLKTLLLSCFHPHVAPNAPQPHPSRSELHPCFYRYSMKPEMRLCTCPSVVCLSSADIRRNFSNLQERDQGLSRPTAAENESTGIQDDHQSKTSSTPPPPPPPPSRSRVVTGPAAAARGAAAPGEAALREQREKREARYKERAIDNALEQVQQCSTQKHPVVARPLFMCRVAPMKSCLPGRLDRIVQQAKGQRWST